MKREERSLGGGMEDAGKWMGPENAQVKAWSPACIYHFPRCVQALGGTSRVCAFLWGLKAPWSEANISSFHCVLQSLEWMSCHSTQAHLWVVVPDWTPHGSACKSCVFIFSIVLTWPKLSMWPERLQSTILQYVQSCKRGEQEGAIHAIWGQAGM